MDKIIFICEDSKKGADIQEKLERSFEVLRKDFCVDEIKACIAENKPLLTVVFIKDVSPEIRQVLHLVLSSISTALC